MRSSKPFMEAVICDKSYGDSEYGDSSNLFNAARISLRRKISKYDDFKYGAK
jgi:hypothetical protein